MKRQFVILGFLLCCGTALVLWWRSEPTYRGRHLSTWLKEYDSGPGSSGAAEADHAIQAIGLKALPYILPDLRPPMARDPESRLRVNHWLERLHLHRFRFSSVIERNERACCAFQILTNHAGITDALIRIYEQGKRRNSRAQYDALLGLTRLGPAARDAFPVLLREAESTNAYVRRGVVRTLGAIQTPPDVLLPVLTNALADPDFDVQSVAADCLGDLGAKAREAIPALKRIAAIDPYEYDSRGAQSSAKNALRKIEEGQAADSKAQCSQPSRTGAESSTSSEVSPPPSQRTQNELATSLAYKHVAVAFMLQEANYCAERLHLQMPLPIEPDHVRQASVSPPRVLGAVGSLDTDRYSFGFGQSGRLRFITRLNPFGGESLYALQTKLAKVPAGITTNRVYELATNWLSAVSVDVGALEATYLPKVQQHFYYATGRQEVLLPIFDVIWGNRNVEPAVIVTIYGPTEELLKLRQNKELFSRRPARLLKDVEGLLALSDEAFATYTASQRSNLVAEFVFRDGAVVEPSRLQKNTASDSVQQVPHSPVSRPSAPNGP